jgi:TolB protein
VNVSNANGDDKTPTWSPESARLAFSSNRSGQFEIFTMTAAGASQKALTNDKRTDVEPAWSPDGTKLTFSSNRATAGTTNGQEIYVMGSANGNSQVRLTTIVGDDVAPFYFDANRIVFASAKVGTTAPLGGLATVAPTGGAVTKIPNTGLGDATPG